MIDENNNIVEVLNKSNKGHSQAFIGAASIIDHEAFGMNWKKILKTVKLLMHLMIFQNTQILQLENWIGLIPEI